MKTQNRLAIAVVILCLLALFFQEEIWNFISEWRLGNDPRPVVAHIDSLNNTVRYRFPTTLIWRKAHEGLDLRDNDTVTTDPDSSTVLSFKSGLKVELEPNSLIVVHNYGGGPDSLELTFLRGGVKVLSSLPGLNLPAQTLKRATIDLSVPEPTPPPKVALEEKPKPSATPRLRKEIRETLPESYISLVIQSQKNLLNRCYIQHLRLNPQAKGRIDTSMTIDPDGSVQRVLVVGSTISDPALQQCVVTVLSRSKFRSYSGDPIIFTYPINFD